MDMRADRADEISDFCVFGILHRKSEAVCSRSEASYIKICEPTERTKYDDFQAKLPAIVSKRLVRFCHLVSIFFLLERAACAVDCIEQFVCKTFCHCSFGSLS